jgi:hypothetical protein
MGSAGEALTGAQVFEVKRHGIIDSKIFAPKRLTPLASMPERA